MGISTKEKKEFRFETPPPRCHPTRMPYHVLIPHGGLGGQRARLWPSTSDSVVAGTRTGIGAAEEPLPPLERPSSGSIILAVRGRPSGLNTGGSYTSTRARPQTRTPQMCTTRCTSLRIFRPKDVYGGWGGRLIYPGWIVRAYLFT